MHCVIYKSSYNFVALNHEAYEYAKLYMARTTCVWYVPYTHGMSYAYGIQQKQMNSVKSTSEVNVVSKSRTEAMANVPQIITHTVVKKGMGRQFNTSCKRCGSCGW